MTLGQRGILGEGLRGGGPVYIRVDRPFGARRESRKGLGSVTFKINTQHTLG